MTYRGRVEHGVIILDDTQSIPDGTEVEILPLPASAAKTVGEELEKLAGRAEGLPVDIAQRHDYYRRERGT